MARLPAVIVGLTLSACAPAPTQPSRPLAVEGYLATGEVAYVWSAGKVRQPVFSMQDFAVVIRIDGVDMPSQYIPGAGSAPLTAWSMAVPAGPHVVEILNKETLMCGASYPGEVCTVTERSRCAVEFVAEPGRAYTPFVDQKCTRKWFWITDSGPYDTNGAHRKSVVFEDGVRVVAGERPPDGACSPADLEGTSTR